MYYNLPTRGVLHVIISIRIYNVSCESRCPFEVWVYSIFSEKMTVN